MHDKHLNVLNIDSFLLFSAAIHCLNMIVTRIQMILVHFFINASLL